MKIITLVLLAGISISAYSQTTLIANNNPGAAPGTASNPNVFTGATALTDAFTAASAGDIIYVVPGGNNYGALIITKSITIFGIGLDPDKDGAALSYMTNVTIKASDVRISGITFTDLVSITLDPAGSVISNIMIDKCLFLRLLRNTNGDAGNIIIQNCIGGDGITGTGDQAIQLETSYSNVRIANNIFHGNGNTQGGTLDMINGADIEHNLFISSTSGSAQRAFGAVTNCNIRNNIFYGIRAQASNTFTGNNIDNNITNFCSDNTIQGGNGNVLTNNLEGVDPQLVNVPFSVRYNFSDDPSLIPGSPCEGAADDGTDIGLFGGGSPMDIRFTPLPLVQVITIPPTVSQGNDMAVNVKAKGN